MTVRVKIKQGNGNDKEDERQTLLE